MHTLRQWGNRVICAVMVGSLLLGGTAMAAPVKPATPLDNLQKMVEVMTDATSAEYRWDIHVNSRSPRYQYIPGKVTKANPYPLATQKVVGTKVGKVDVSLEGRQGEEQGEMHIIANVKIDNKTTLSVDADVRLVDKAIYFKLNKVSGLDGSMEENEALTKYLGRWIYVSPDMVKEEIGTDRFENQLNLLQTKKKELNEDQQKVLNRFKELIVRHKVFTIRTLRSEKVNGVDTFHYSITLNKRGLANAIVEYATKDEGKVMTPAEIKKFHANFDKHTKSLVLPTIEVWIGKNDFTLRKMTMKTGFSLKTVGLDWTLNLSTKVVYTSVNKPVLVEAPAPVRTFEEFERALSGTSSEVSDTQETL
ncbi:MAG TPA: hypothetical protein VEA18_00895 [Candidatus Kapabacteria bacterium]|nr:hypothetical protein [Candidatus Kapabacteria bacterium]